MPTEGYAYRITLFHACIPFLLLLIAIVVMLVQGFREGEDTRRVEKRFIGSLRVPFTTVYLSGKIEGMFKVDVPCLHLGYRR